MRRSKYIKILSIRFIGYFLIFSSIAGMFWTIYPALEVEAGYRLDALMGRRYKLTEDNSKEKKVADKKDNQFLPPFIGITPVNRSFSIVIPKIKANSPVVANVDSQNETAYLNALKEGVAHAAGTNYPGEKGNVFLFAHSSGNFWETNRYNAVFYLINQLNPGDEIDVFFNGKRYLYTVFDSKVVEAGDLEIMNSRPNFAQLTLQTCWPAGTALKRLVVLAKLTQ